MLTSVGSLSTSYGCYIPVGWVIVVREENNKHRDESILKKDKPGERWGEIGEGRVRGENKGGRE